MEHALLIMTALVLNALLAGPPSLYAALGLTSLARLPARMLLDLERRLNREHRSPQERGARGALLLLLVAAGSLGLGLLAENIFVANLRFVELAFLILALPVRPAYDRISRLKKALQAHHHAAAREAFLGTAWRHALLLDEPGLCRAGMEWLAVHFSEKLFAPIFWYLLFGLPGLWLCKSVTLVQEVQRRPMSAESDFSRSADMAHRIVHFIPSRLVAILWMVVSLFLGARRSHELLLLWAAILDVTPPQPLIILAACTTLGVALGGPYSIYTQERWMGKNLRPAGVTDVNRALYSYGVLLLFLFILLGLFL